MVKTCADWNLVSTELVVANGDPQVIAIPVGMNDARWLIVRRLVAGAAIEDPNEPFHVQQFDGVSAAFTAYNGISADLKPRMFSAPDGQVLVISLRQAVDSGKRRAILH